MSLHKNTSLREAVQRAIALGATVECPRRTGELLFTHPATPKRVRVNARRKDCPQPLVSWLRQLEVRCKR